MFRPWGVSAKNGELYRYDRVKDKGLIGHCTWKPKDGDICVCTGHSGDYFHDYIALRKSADGLYRMVGKFGAYRFGQKVGQIKERDFFLAQAGEPVTLEIKQ